MRYPTPKSGEWIRPVMKGYRMLCCDCGLVHQLDFKVIRWGRGHKVKFKVFRNERATSAARRARQVIKT